MPRLVSRKRLMGQQGGVSHIYDKAQMHEGMA